MRSVLAFLKRRWFLVTCTLALTLCGLFDCNQEIVRQGWTTKFGLEEGQFFYDRTSYRHLIWVQYGADHLQCNLHWNSPSYAFARMPFFDRQRFVTGMTHVAFPLWLPLFVVINWIVFREVRWREKMRANKRDS